MIVPSVPPLRSVPVVPIVSRFKKLQPYPRSLGAVSCTGFSEAKKRFGLYVLDYMVTSNHVHLLVKETGGDVIAQSMQLIAGRIAQEYNQGKNRHGAFWEDRYHATAIEDDEHLHRCLVYIDLNMVRAGVVNDPAKWGYSGYREIQELRR